MATQNTPNKQAPPKADEPKTEESKAPTIPTGDNPMAERQIRRAYLLEHQKGELLEAVNSNRELLRLMADTDELSEAQEIWLDTFYPVREDGGKRSDAELEATKKLRDAARKHKVA